MANLRVLKLKLKLKVMVMVMVMVTVRSGGRAFGLMRHYEQGVAVGLELMHDWI